MESTVSIDGVTVPAEVVAAEADALAAVGLDAEHAAVSAVLKTLLLRRAGELGISGTTEDEAIDALLVRELIVPEPTSAECRRYYDRHPDQFIAGELVAARHILFAVTEATPIEALRRQAEAILIEVRSDPERFGDLARQYSNCPSGEVGGELGQLTRDQVAPEFGSAVFGKPDLGVLPRLVNSRFGFHVVEIQQRVPGRPLAFEAVAERIRAVLGEQVRMRALRQYLALLAAEADIGGVVVGLVGGPPTSPLVQ